MALRIVRNDNRFRLESQHFCSDWVSHTGENRKAMLVFLRLLRGKDGRPSFTHQQSSGFRKGTSREYNARREAIRVGI